MADDLDDLEPPAFFKQEKPKAKPEPVAEEPPKKGHNRVIAGGIDSKVLTSFVDRIERVNDEIGELQDDRKDLFTEAKGAGLNPKTLRKIITMRKKREDERKAELEETELYMLALGML